MGALPRVTPVPKERSSKTRRGDIDAEQLSSELIRALRGKRSQTGFSRRLGYRSNIVYRWESRQCWPKAADFFARLQKLGWDVEAALGGMFQRPPAWLSGKGVSPKMLASFLCDLKGTASILETARLAGVNRFTLSRWLKGSIQPSLPDFFRFVQAASKRLLDLVRHWVDPQVLPCVRERWRRLEQARALAYEHPWAHAVLRVLQLDAYTERAPERLDSLGWIADRLGIEPEEVEGALHALQAAGQVRREGARWVARAGVERLATGSDAKRARELKLWWTRVAVQRLEAGTLGSFGFSLFEISAADLVKVRDLHLEFVRAMQQIVASSRGTDRLGLYSSQLLELSQTGNALALEGTAARKRGQGTRSARS